MIPSSAYIAVGRYLLNKSREHDLNHIYKTECKIQTENDGPSYGSVLYDILRDLGADVFIDFFL